MELSLNILSSLQGMLCLTRFYQSSMQFSLPVLDMLSQSPRAKDKDKSNYSGISLLSSMANLWHFEKLLLSKIKDDLSPLNPLQGGFRVGYSCLHSVFIFQESIQSIGMSSSTGMLPHLPCSVPCQENFRFFTVFL